MVLRTGEDEAEPWPSAVVCGKKKSVNFSIRRLGLDCCLSFTWLSNPTSLGLNFLIRIMGWYHLHYSLHKVFRRVERGNVHKTNESFEKKQNSKHVSLSQSLHFSFFTSSAWNPLSPVSHLQALFKCLCVREISPACLIQNRSHPHASISLSPFLPYFIWWHISPSDLTYFTVLH